MRGPRSSASTRPPFGPSTTLYKRSSSSARTHGATNDDNPAPARAVRLIDRRTSFASPGSPRELRYRSFLAGDEAVGERALADHRRGAVRRTRRRAGGGGGGDRRGQERVS